jgi:hypothetical protein
VGGADLSKRQPCVQRSNSKGHVTATKGGRLRYVPFTIRLAAALRTLSAHACSVAILVDADLKIVQTCKSVARVGLWRPPLTIIARVPLTITEWEGGRRPLPRRVTATRRQRRPPWPRRVADGDSPNAALQVLAKAPRLEEPVIRANGGDRAAHAVGYAQGAPHFGEPSTHGPALGTQAPHGVKRIGAGCAR